MLLVNGIICNNPLGYLNNNGQKFDINYDDKIIETFDIYIAMTFDYYYDFTIKVNGILPDECIIDQHKLEFKIEISSIILHRPVNLEKTFKNFRVTQRNPLICFNNRYKMLKPVTRRYPDLFVIEDNGKDIQIKNNRIDIIRKKHDDFLSIHKFINNICTQLYPISHINTIQEINPIINIKLPSKEPLYIFYDTIQVMKYGLIVERRNIDKPLVYLYFFDWIIRLKIVEEKGCLVFRVTLPHIYIIYSLSNCLSYIINNPNNTEAIYNNILSYDPRIEEEIFSRKLFKLRKEKPDLFISQFTRECSRAPTIVTREEARRLIEEGYSVIRYPKHPDPKGVFYVAPKGMYVGLKTNRLTNKDIYPFLPNCYITDHLKNPGTKAFQYYYRGLNVPKESSSHRVSNIIKQLKSWSQGIAFKDNLRQSVEISRCSILHCIFFALNDYEYINYEDKIKYIEDKRKFLPFKPWLINHIFPFSNDEEIMNDLYNLHIDCSKYCNYLSKVFHINIIPLQLEYFPKLSIKKDWKSSIFSLNPILKCMVVANIPPPSRYQYIEKQYELIINNNNKLFNVTDPVIQYIMSQITDNTPETFPDLSPEYLIEQEGIQYINNYGYTIKVDNHHCYMRPLDKQISKSESKGILGNMIKERVQYLNDGCFGIIENVKTRD